MKTNQHQGREQTRPIRVYTSQEAEHELRLSKNSVNMLLRTGQLRSVRAGRKYLIPVEAIDEFLKGKQS